MDPGYQNHPVFFNTCVTIPSREGTYTVSVKYLVWEGGLGVVRASGRLTALFLSLRPFLDNPGLTLGDCSHYPIHTVFGA